MTFNEWIQRQHAIYNDFEQQRAWVLNNGSLPGAVLATGEGGYIVALRHSLEISQSIADLANKINHIIPSIIYDNSNVHTTLISFGQDSNFAPKSEILTILLEAIKLASVKGFKPTIDFDKWLINREAVIAAGRPNDDFYNLFMDLSGTISRLGLEVGLPKMSHITVARFREAVDPGTLRQVDELLHTTPPPHVSTNMKVVSGYFSLTPTSFRLHLNENKSEA